MNNMEFKDWAKTPDGVDAIGTAVPFCYNGELWQGFHGTAYRCQERNLETSELKAVIDMDNTIDKVWLTRHQRMEARFSRKAKEYDQKKAVLRRERNEIRVSIRGDKELGIPESPDDIVTIRRIDERMQKLSLLAEEEELKTAAMRGKSESLGLSPEDVPLEKVVEEVAETHIPKMCDWPDCEKMSPPGKDPDKWVKAHKLGAHIGPQKRLEAKIKEAAEAAANGS